MIALAEFDVIAEGLAFPEGPVVFDDGSIIIVEVAGGKLTRAWGDGRKELVAIPGGGPNGAAIGADGALYLCNNGGLELSRFGHRGGPDNEGRIERVDISTGKIERLYDHCDGIPLSAPNDIVVDKNGDLWFTDLGKILETSHDLSVLFHAKPDGSFIRRVHSNVGGFNGVGLSPDGKSVYFSETFSARLMVIDADPETNAPVRLVGTAPGLVGLDSLAVTAAGNICVAQLYVGGVATFAPEGAVDVVRLPDDHVTNIAFGGNDMRDAYITLSGRGLLIKVRWQEPGLKLHYGG